MLKFVSDRFVTVEQTFVLQYCMAIFFISLYLEKKTDAGWNSFQDVIP